VAIVLDRIMKEDTIRSGFIPEILKGSIIIWSPRINSMTSKWAKIGYFNIGADKIDPNKKSDKKLIFRS